MDAYSLVSIVKEALHFISKGLRSYWIFGFPAHDQGCETLHTLPGFDQDALWKDVPCSVIHGTVQEMLY